VDALTAAAFLDELQKIAFADSHMELTKSREGRRPISVDKLLDKDKRGELYKAADSQGNPQDTAAGSVDDPGAAKAKKSPGDTATRGEMIPLEQKYGALQGSVFAEGASPVPVGESPNMNPEAKKPRKKGDVPSMDDVNAVDRYDQRENATTVTGLGQNSSGIGAFNQPGEHA
jgi:hypothetical protein